MTEAVAGIDVGGTKIAVTLESMGGERIAARRFPTLAELGPEAILGNIAGAVAEMSAEARVNVLAVGLGCPGSADKERGTVLNPINLPGWHGFPVVRTIEELLKVPAAIENDAKLAALGEHAHGAGRGFTDIVYLTISTGVGGGVIVNNQLLRRLGAGEIGHMTVLPDGPPCGCGSRGCLDALCSGTAIARRARELIAAGETSVITQLVAGPEKITARTVAEAARNGDALAGRVWDEMIHYLSIGVGNVITILAPEAVVLGGGVASSGEQLLGPLRPLVVQRATMIPVESVRILQAALGGESGIHGALVLARQVLSTP
ncbi:MAG TPA: ROK family protein [Pyrinomonadaceae bacterium]|nr:ROK family protein [Pyrinomonadaceae bacterium]